MLSREWNRPMAVLLLLTLLGVGLTFFDGVPGGRTGSFLRLTAFIVLIYAWAFGVYSVLRSRGRSAVGIVSVTLLSICFLLLGCTIAARVFAGLYLVDSLNNRDGTFIAYVWSQYGEVVAEEVQAKDKVFLTRDMLHYDRSRKPHGKIEWTTIDEGSLLREETAAFGVLHGPTKSYHPSNGALYFSGQYKRGYFDGHWEIFRADGTRFAHGEFDLGAPVAATWVYYDESGDVVSEGVYRGNRSTFFLSKDR